MLVEKFCAFPFPTAQNPPLPLIFLEFQKVERKYVLNVLSKISLASHFYERESLHLSPAPSEA